MSTPNPHLKERLFEAVRAALVKNGMDPRVRIHLVLDGEPINADAMSFGNVPPDKLRLLIDRTLAGHNRQTFEAVQALSKFTLNGIPPHLRIKHNG